MQGADNLDFPMRRVVRRGTIGGGIRGTLDVDSVEDGSERLITFFSHAFQQLITFSVNMIDQKRGAKHVTMLASKIVGQSSPLRNGDKVKRRQFWLINPVLRRPKDQPAFPCYHVPLLTKDHFRLKPSVSNPF